MPELESRISEQGLQLPLQKWAQSFAGMSPCMDAFEQAVLNGQLRHDGHPILAWCLSNVSVSTDSSGNRKLDKSRSRDKIDLAVASVLAVGIAAATPEPVPFEFSPMVVEF